MKSICKYQPFDFYSLAGGIVLLAIGVLSRGFVYIPRTALAAIIITAVLPMVELRILLKIKKLRRELGQGPITLGTLRILAVLHTGNELSVQAAHKESP